MTSATAQLAVRLPGDQLDRAARALGLDGLSRSQLLRYFAARRAGRDETSALAIAGLVGKPVTADDHRFIAQIPPDVLDAAMRNMPPGSSQGDMIRSALYEFGFGFDRNEAIARAKVPMGHPRRNPSQQCK